MRILLAAILALVLAGTACAETFPVDVPPDTKTDSGYGDIRPYTEGDIAVDIVHTATGVLDTIDLVIDPDGIPVRLHLHIAAETDLSRIRIVFKEMTATADLTGDAAYAWGDTVELCLNELKFTETLAVSLWDSAKLWFVSTTGDTGLVDACWRVEKFTNSE